MPRWATCATHLPSSVVPSNCSPVSAFIRPRRRGCFGQADLAVELNDYDDADRKYARADAFGEPVMPPAKSLRAKEARDS
jgi:hypothetical protein